MPVVKATNLKSIIAILLILSSASFAYARNTDARTLLKKALGDAIEIESDKEIWYCPDNTCEIYSAKESNPDFPAYVYLHLFHKSTYAYLNLSVGDTKSFRAATAADEPEIRKKLTKYCSSGTADSDCILGGMESKLGISTCFGRYDEGGFWGCDQFREKALQK